MMTEPVNLMSWYSKLYPLHACPKCRLEHTRIPHIQQKDVTWLPLELVAIVEGSIHPGRTGRALMDTPAHLVGLLWGFPRGDRPLLQTIMYLN